MEIKLKRLINWYANAADWYRKETVFDRMDGRGKRLKFEHITKGYMHKLESVQEKETYSLGFWDTIGSPNFSQKARLNFM